jgi:hypothetical protein
MSIIFPAKGVDKVLDVYLQEVLDGFERIRIGGGIKIKRPPQEMPGGITHKKLT